MLRLQQQFEKKKSQEKEFPCSEHNRKLKNTVQGSGVYNIEFEKSFNEKKKISKEIKKKHT